MSNKSKRYRQINILESFAFSKKPRIDYSTMNQNPDDRLSATTTSSGLQKEMMMSKHFDETERSVCQATENSTMNLNPDVRLSATASSSGLQKEMMTSKNLDGTENSACQAAEDSIEVKSDLIKVVPESAEVKKQNCDSTIIQNSADLFPEESPSLEDFSGPSSSHSEELFEDSPDDSSENADTGESSSNSEELDQLSYLIRTPECCLPLPQLKPLENHTILFSMGIHPAKVPRPYPTSYRDKWDSAHVRMPCSPFNRFPVADSAGEKHIESRWNLICRSLRSNIETSQDLEDAIMKYNSQYIGKWSFSGLHDFINKHLTDGERDHFFEVILPVMIEIALDLPNICTQPIPLLKKGNDHHVSMSQYQIGCLLLNAFFCTFPRRNLPSKHSKQRWTCEFANYPDINFNRLFYGTKHGILPRNAEKLKCLLNYFRRITTEKPTGVVTFHRQSLQDNDLPKWYSSTRGIKLAVIKSSGLIECDGSGMLQVDFANKFVGGGVIGQGCVQEEIRFVICPELIVSRLFVECLGNNEALIVTGVEQYNKYSGYADTFKWEGNFKDETPRDSWSRRYTQLVAMDAIHFNNPDDQFKFKFIKRELNKAYCAFYENSLPIHLPSVATGNWGCGAFKGNPNLKFLIQLMAASQTGRTLLYLTFGNKKLKTQLQSMYKFLNDKNLAVGDVWRLLMRYTEEVSISTTNSSDLYDFIYGQFQSKKEHCLKEDGKSTEQQTLPSSDELVLQKLIDDVMKDNSSTETESVT